eukprot:CAMPEP_0119144928 /NCGR_PEP_ID=MMETSP1310-20130426/36726_1 /TAXON_ID=464262 /ORGANISM="Genus nov. species nov., Strain RCC2339" /LENGTH=35 /DNA_ID= /DNA_START= /DNA_END= /DNA_ORIENTATION=
MRPQGGTLGQRSSAQHPSGYVSQSETLTRRSPPTA